MDDEPIDNEWQEVEDEAQQPLEPEVGPEIDEEEAADDDDDEDDEEEPDFAEMCRRLHCNDPDYIEYMTPPIMSNGDAARLSSALYRNRVLKHLTITMGPNFTTWSARVLGHAVTQSKIDSVTLRVESVGEQGEEAPPDVAPILFQKVIQTVTKMHLMLRLSEADAIQIKEALILPGNTDGLESLGFHVPNLTATTAKSLAQGIKGSSIKSLDALGGNMDNPDVIMRILYLEGIQDAQINDLSVYGNIGDMHALVTILPPIRSLTLAFINQFSVADMQLLVNGLRSMQHLEYLALWVCSFSDEHIRILITDFLTHPAIRKKIQDNPASQFKLGVQNDFIGPLAAQSLIQATVSFSAFKTLDLGDTPSIGYEGLSLIGKALPNSMLRELILRGAVEWVDYDDENDQRAHAQQLKCNQAAEALVDGVRNNFHLLVLNLEDLQLPPKAVDEIEFYLEMNYKFGRHLLSQQHSLPLSIWSLILAKFSHNLSVVLFYVRELPLLVSQGMITGRKRRR